MTYVAKETFGAGVVPVQTSAPITVQPSTEHPPLVWVCSKLNSSRGLDEDEWHRQGFCRSNPTWCQPTFIIQKQKRHNILLERWPYLLLATQHGHKQDFTNATDTQEQWEDPHAQVRFITRKDGTMTQTQRGTQYTQEMRGREGLTLQSVWPTFWPDPHL